jgi:hypothetical protein
MDVPWRETQKRIGEDDTLIGSAGLRPHLCREAPVLQGILPPLCLDPSSASRTHHG